MKTHRDSFGIMVLPLIPIYDFLGYHIQIGADVTQALQSNEQSTEIVPKIRTGRVEPLADIQNDQTLYLADLVDFLHTPQIVPRIADIASQARFTFDEIFGLLDK